MTISPAVFDRSAALVAEASKLLPGGVSSNFRLGISPTPLVIERGEGAWLVDADGNRLIDYYLGMGPMVLGHNPPVVVEAVRTQLESGLLFAGQTAVEYRAAARLCELAPCAERVRFASSGSEAVHAAIRLARAATSRSVVVKFEGHYHGWFDSILWSTSPPLAEAGPADAPQRVAGSRGQDPACGGSVEVLGWNDLAVLEARLARGDVAAVIMEPAMCNTGLIQARPGYLEGARAACSAHGAVLIFDEVITGFRVAPGGAQALFGVTPDLAVFGKAIASGFPVAAVAGRADLMEQFASGGVLHGGTYNAQPISMAAALATMDEIATGEPTRVIDAAARRLADGLADILARAGVTGRVARLPGIVHLAFGVGPELSNYRDAARADRAAFVRFATAMLRRGVRVLERGTWFLSTEHDAAVIDATLEVAEGALREITAAI